MKSIKSLLIFAAMLMIIRPALSQSETVYLEKKQSTMRRYLTALPCVLTSRMNPAAFAALRNALEEFCHIVASFNNLSG
ncbi:hypothetical protein [Nitrosomonas sp. Nm132]|uniref:hypothetical protein n=1 Tax=Nitrosomonas sp. Nm132 TaxID=1881053 RepID=UPI00088C603C|nr:hypothetical protein [Nitrosomonas sp. Nm132]SDH87746.1 hypothetical protein SAMN05428952_103917 [Nitrosomonas sp. Nm132]